MPMSIAKITMRDIKQCHPIMGGAYATDFYYTQLANKLMKRFSRLRVDLGPSASNIIRYASLLVANYMEDVVSDSGVWRSFSEMCRKFYGYDVPMFHHDDEYAADEPSMSAVRYLIWHAANEMDDFWWYSDQSDLLLMAETAYELLDDEFEKAPINTQLVSDIDLMLNESASNFHKMRSALMWVYSRCYLTRCTDAEETLDRRLSESAEQDFMKHDESMQFYSAYTFCVFAYKTGPLAVYPKDYLEQLMRTRSMNDVADNVATIEMIPYGLFRYKTSFLGKDLLLERTNGRKITVARDEITLPDEQLKQYNAFMASFVWYQSAWNLNGILSPFNIHGADEWKRMRDNDPENLPENTSTAGADYFINRADGRQLLFFDDKEDVRKFMQQRLGFGAHLLSFLDELSDGPLMMFFDKTEPKNVLQFSHGCLECVADKNNRFYSSESAQVDAPILWWNEECASTGLMNYLIDHSLVPDVYKTPFFIPENTQQEKENDARFLLRYIRKMKY